MYSRQPVIIILEMPTLVTQLCWQIVLSVLEMAAFQSSASFVKLLVAVVMTLCGNRAVEYCVGPDESVPLCSGIPACAENCHNLTHYIDYNNRYGNLSSNTTFLFLPGDHLLVTSTLISNVSLVRLTTSHSKANIICTHFSGGLSFFNITNLTIERLNIFNCSKPSHVGKVYAALEITLVYNLVIVLVEIHNTTGYGLMLTDIFGHSLIASTLVESSHCARQIYGGNLKLYWDHNDHKKAVLLVRDSHFLNGRNVGYASGVFIELHQTNLKVIMRNSSIIGNTGSKGGNVAVKYSQYSNIEAASVVIQECNISRGITSNMGGGLYGTVVIIPYRKSNTTIPFEVLGIEVENTRFEHNESPHVGAAVYVRFHETNTPSIGIISFANCIFDNNTLSFPANRTVGHGGVAVHIIAFKRPLYTQHATIFFKSKFSNCNFTDSKIKHTSPSFESSRNAVLFVLDVHIISLENCSFVHSMCTGIITINSNIMLYGYNLIRNHTGTRGGGMVFCAGSKMHLSAGTYLNITENSATQYGGGIFIEDDCSQVVPYCFFQVDSYTWNTTVVSLTNNNVTFAGSALYGGLINDCLLYEESLIQSNIFKSVFHISGGTEGVSRVSSNPITTCFCQKGTFNSSESNNNCSYSTSIDVVPGSSFQIPAILLGQHYGPVPGVVNTKCIGDCSIQVQQRTQTLWSYQPLCPRLNYTVFSDENTIIKLQLIVEDSYYQYSSYTDRSSEIIVHVQRCPLGFVSHKQSCVCLVHKSIMCNITTSSITREPPVWIGFPLFSTNSASSDIIFHEFCPFNYCLDKNITITTNASFFDQDAQCAQQRSGLLCGKCKHNYSLQFGSSECTVCHQNYFRIIGLILFCVIAGILLVLMLTLLNLTVSDGVLNGLIFYANIIQVNKDIFFPRDSRVRLLTTFIAWMNLDIGVNVCFYHGMDTFAKAWLQSIFPVYVWMLSAAIIYFSRKLQLVSKLAGKNAVKVLATLFLLSFGKLSRIIITAASVTTVTSISKNFNRVVWLPDADIDYMTGHHISLFVFGCIAGIATLLYAFCLSFIQCLRRAPNGRLTSWVQRLKPLFDAYTGPYKDNYHFWTGLLLLIRVLLFIIFAVNVRGSPALKLTFIVAVCLTLLIAMQPGIYRNTLLGIIESSLYVNLAMFSTVTMGLMADTYMANTYRVAAVYVFVGSALLTFLAIVFFHGYKQVCGVPICSQLKAWGQELRARLHGTVSIQPLTINNNISDSDDSEDDILGSSELREPLVDYIH